MKQEILLLRHGQTPGNALRRYVGVTDEPLTPAGMAALKPVIFPGLTRVYVSPLRRCRETAALCFPGLPQTVIPDLREMNFGVFENRSYADMAEDADYAVWLASNCEAPIPGGERKADFVQRCCAAFETVLFADPSPRLAFVVHGGTLMSILSRNARPRKSYYDWSVGNGCGFLLTRDWPGSPLLTLNKEVRPE